MGSYAVKASGKLRKSQTALLRDDYSLSIKHLLDHLYDELDSERGLPKGFTGATITDLLSMLMTAKEIKLQENLSLAAWSDEFSTETQ